MRLIDADAFIEEARSRIDMQGLYLPIHIKEMVLDEMPTVDAVPVEFIKGEIKNNKGFYNSSLRRLLDAWAERKEHETD